MASAASARSTAAIAFTRGSSASSPVSYASDRRCFPVPVLSIAFAVARARAIFSREADSAAKRRSCRSISPFSSFESRESSCWMRSRWRVSSADFAFRKSRSTPSTFELKSNTILGGAFGIMWTSNPARTPLGVSRTSIVPGFPAALSARAACPYLAVREISFGPKAPTRSSSIRLTHVDNATRTCISSTLSCGALWSAAAWL